jgi:hypothetical protein
MKKLLLSLLVIGLGAGFSSAQDRYLDEIFPSATSTGDVTFGENFNFFSGADGFPLKTDVYEPVGDTETNRAAVIVLHTGNFLPQYCLPKEGMLLLPQITVEVGDQLVQVLTIEEVHCFPQFTVL